MTRSIMSGRYPSSKLGKLPTGSRSGQLARGDRVLEVVTSERFGKRAEAGGQPAEQALEAFPIALGVGTNQFLRIGELDRAEEASDHAPSSTAARIAGAAG